MIMKSKAYENTQIHIISKHYETSHKLFTFILKSNELIGNIVSSLETFMERNTFNTPSQAIGQLTEWLGINETYLAGFLGVTPKSLADWKSRRPGELPPKAHRLVRLHAVVSYLKSRHPELPPRDYKGLLENGRLTINPDDAEEGTISLLNFIISDPNAKVWAPCVDHVVVDYQNLLNAAGKLREANRPVRHAL